MDRLYGNEVNEYTMVNVCARFPANPPADTIKIGGQLVEQVCVLVCEFLVCVLVSYATCCRLTSSPYLARSPTCRVCNTLLSVSTRISVCLRAIINPSLAMFRGFAKGCISEGYEWSLQLSALSSYAPIKIWRIDPFAYCPYDGTDR